MNRIVKLVARPGIRALAAAASLLATALSPVPSYADDGCVSDWGAAGTIVREQGLRTVEQVAREGRNGVAGKIVQATLCQAGARYVYRLVVRDPSGLLKNVVVEASAGPGSGK